MGFFFSGCGHKFPIGSLALPLYSFENNGTPEKEGWKEDGICYKDAPPGGGSWCLMVSGGGCMNISTDYKVINGIKNGETWKLTFWSKGYGKIGWKTDSQDCNITISSSNWKSYVIEEKVKLKKDELTIFIEVHGGIIPVACYVDLVELRRTK